MDRTDADNKGAHAIALGRLGAEMYGSLVKRLDVMNEELQATKQELLETKQELQATNQATDRKLKATMKELLATRELSQAMREALRETKQSTEQKLRETEAELRETTQTANRILRESNRELQSATQEMQMTEHAIGQELFEVRARLDQEVMGLNRLSRDTVELCFKTQDKTEERFCEVIQLLKGLMGVASRMIGHEDVSPETEALAAFVSSRTTEMTAGTTRGTARTMAGGEAGSGWARMPQSLCTAASNDDLVRPPRSRPLATTGTTGLASSRLSRFPHVSNNLDDSSTDSGPASPAVPPPRVLPFPTTVNLADSSTDSGPASPVADSVPPPPILSDDAFDNSSSL